MRIGFQGETHSYSYRAASELFPSGEFVGFPSFAAEFHALEHDGIDRLVVPVEYSTTCSLLPGR